MTLLLVGLVLLLGLAPLAFSQSANDGFDPNANGAVLAAVVQPDGKIILGGQFTTLGGVARSALARINTDGSLDTAFNPGVGGSSPVVRALALQPDGKILVGGEFTALGAQSCTNIGRLNADGSPDTSFNPGASASVRAILRQPDGNILVGGQFTILGGGACARLGRLTSGGSLEANFNPGADATVTALALQADGKIVAGGEFSVLGGQPRSHIGRLNADGAVDANFNPGADAFVDSLALQADGKLVAGGEFGALGGQARNHLGRLNADGSLDAIFNPSADNSVLALVTQPDGRILVGGTFTSLGAQSRSRLGRLNSDGSLDLTFTPGASADANNLILQPDGKILVVGQFTTLAGQVRNRVGRLYPNGSLDATFNPTANNFVISLVPQPDGKVLAGGEFTRLSGQARTNLARLNPDGSLDPTFNAGASDGIVVSTISQPDGKILVGGQFTQLGGQPRANLGRMNTNGSLDTTFITPAGDINSIVYALARQADGGVLVAGIFTNLGGRACTNLGRLHPDGSVDKSFNPGPDYFAACVAVQEDGKILVGGVFDQVAGQARTNVARLNADGSIDTTFKASAGDINSAVYCLVVQPDGKILISGQFNVLNGQARTNIGRLNADGSLDASFNPRSGNGVVATLVLQTDARILLGGQFNAMGGKLRTNFCRLNADGTLDGAFNAGVGDTNAFVYSLAAQADGKILVGGLFTTMAGQARSYLGRLTSGAPATQRLEVPSGGTSVIWSRAGTGPEVQQVAFEQSIDGINYVPLGAGTRGLGGWSVTGLSFPHNQTFYVRSRGWPLGGFVDGSSALIESVGQFYIANRPPVAVCSNATVLADASCLASVSIDNGSFDPDAGDTLTVSQSPPGPYPLGSTLVSLTATDNYGASSSCTGTVTVIDLTPPTLTCPSNLVLSAIGRNCSLGVPYTVTASAHCGEATVQCVPPSGAIFRQGTTTVSCTALDTSSNASSCSFTITVKDADPPQMVYPSSLVLNTAAGTCANNPLFSVGARDNCSDVITIICVPPSGSSFLVGTTTVNCTATDLAGNTSAVSFPVTVLDAEPPVLTCPAAVVTNTAPGRCDTLLSFAVTATDNCLAAVIVVCAPPSGSSFPKGSTNVTCTATDAAGNIGTCSFPVTVNDLEPPSISCPADIEMIFASETGASATFSASASDNCGVASSACTPPSGSQFPIGLTTVHCVASDGVDLRESCSFAINVLGAKGLKQQVLAELTSLGSTATNRDDVNALADAGLHLAASLDPSLWMDETHLQPARGERVFNEEKQSAHQLAKLQKGKKSGMAPDVVQSWIERMARADRLLAGIENLEAAAAGVNLKKIAENNAELARGEAAMSNGKYEEAIDHYRNAWKHALHLVVKATPKTDGSVHLEFVALTAGPYLIQSSTNLVDWMTIGSCASDPQGRVVYDDPPVNGAPRRFYRVVSP